MNVRLVRVQFFRLAHRGKGFGILLLVHQDGGNIEVRETVVAPESGGLAKECQGFFGVLAFHRDVSEIGQGLGVSGVDQKLSLERRGGLVVVVSLPVKIAQPKIQVWFFWREFERGFELGDGLFRLALAVESLAGEDMHRGRIRVLLLKLSKLLERAGVILGHEAALRQHLVQLSTPLIGC